MPVSAGVSAERADVVVQVIANDKENIRLRPLGGLQRGRRRQDQGGEEYEAGFHRGVFQGLSSLE